MQVQPVCSACVMFAAVLEAIEHRFHESMRATRAWIHENGARSLSRLLQPSHRLSRLAQPAQSCAYHEMQDVVMRMRAWKHIFRIAARARCERCIDLDFLRATHVSTQCGAGSPVRGASIAPSETGYVMLCYVMSSHPT